MHGTFCFTVVKDCFALSALTGSGQDLPVEDTYRLPFFRNSL
jgi:hypothetical protein